MKIQCCAFERAFFLNLCFFQGDLARNVYFSWSTFFGLWLGFLVHLLVLTVQILHPCAFACICIIIWWKFYWVDFYNFSGYWEGHISSVLGFNYVLFFKPDFIVGWVHSVVFSTVCTFYSVAFWFLVISVKATRTQQYPGTVISVAGGQIFSSLNSRVDYSSTF